MNGLKRPLSTRYVHFSYDSFIYTSNAAKVIDCFDLVRSSESALPDDVSRQVLRTLPCSRQQIALKW